MRRLIAAVAVVGLLAGCGDDDATVVPPPDVSTATTDTFGDLEDVLAAMEEEIALREQDPSLDECGFTSRTGGRPYAAGSITNSSDEALTYYLIVEMDVDIDIPVDPDAPDPFGVGPATLLVDVEDVRPGETVEWQEVDDFWMGPEGLVVDWVGSVVECALVLDGVQPLASEAANQGEETR